MRTLIAGGLAALGLVLPLAPPGEQGAQAAGRSTTTVRPGEDCQALVRRVYGNTPGAMARFHAANPQLGGLPHALHAGDVVNTPPMGQHRPRRPRREPPVEPVRLGYVAPGGRTQEPGATWAEALPEQFLGRRTRVQAGASGAVEVKVTEQLRLKLLPGGDLVLEALPAEGRPAQVELLDGTLIAAVPRGAAVLVRTPAGTARLRGDARVEALGTEARVAVYSGGALVRDVAVAAGMGTLLRRGERPRPEALPQAPAWSREGPLLGLAVAPIVGPGPPSGRVLVEHAPVDGAARYLVEIARDPRFNDRRAGGESEGPSVVVSVPPGSFHARVSAVSPRGLVGPPGPPRSIAVVTLRSDARPAALQHADGRILPVLERAVAANVAVPPTGQPLLLGVDGAPPRPCADGCAVRLGPGPHRLALHLRGPLSEARAEALVFVEPDGAPAAARAVEPPEAPPPLWAPGFPMRALHPRTRAWALLGFGAARRGPAADTGRLDLGGEMAFLGRRLSVDLNLPLLYHDAGPAEGQGIAAGDLAIGFRGLALSTWGGRVALGPLLRLQLPTGTFPRPVEPGSRPVVLDPAVGVSLHIGPVGLLTTQGPTAVVNLARAQLRWAMSHAAELCLWRLSLAAALDAAVGMIEGSESGAALSGGARLRLGRARLLGVVRGGLGEGGEALFGRYYVGLGAEWVR